MPAVLALDEHVDFAFEAEVDAAFESLEEEPAELAGVVLEEVTELPREHVFDEGRIDVGAL